MLPTFIVVNVLHYYIVSWLTRESFQVLDIIILFMIDARGDCGILIENRNALYLTLHICAFYVNFVEKESFCKLSNMVYSIVSFLDM